MTEVDILQMKCIDRRVGEGKLSIIMHLMEKDFDTWNEQKKILENKKQTVLCKEGDIWWTSIGINVAAESCGK